MEVEPRKDAASWRELFELDAAPLGYARREELRSSFFKAAEREHGRAALLGAAVITSVAWDARLAPLVLFARCGCPSALQQFAAGAPNLAVEAPLAVAGLAYLAREVRRSLDAPALDRDAPTDPDAAVSRARGRRAELFQGRVAMLGTASVVLLAQPLTGHGVDAQLVSEAVDAVSSVSVDAVAYASEVVAAAADAVAAAP